MDASFLESGSTPVLSPLAGFSSITAPEISLETHEIQEGNKPFKKKLIKFGDTSSITLQRGQSFTDSDFYNWTMSALYGNTAILSGVFGRLNANGGAALGGLSPRRNLLLIQFFTHFPVDPGSMLRAALQLGPQDLVARVPAKAFVLKNALPVRYKAGSDFDATSGAVSIHRFSER